MPFTDTLTLIEMCRWELNRLHDVVAAFNAFNEAGRKIAAEPFKTEIRRDDVLLRRTSIRFLLGRADEARAFVEEVNDPEVKRLLLKLAESYEQIAERAGAVTAKAEDLLSAGL